MIQQRKHLMEVGAEEEYNEPTYEEVVESKKKINNTKTDSINKLER